MQRLLTKLKSISNSKGVSSLLKYAVAAVLLAVPLYPKFPFISVPGTYVSIRLEDFVVFVAFAVSLLIIIPNFKTFFKDKINVSIVLFLLVGLVSVLSAIFLTKTAPLSIATLHWIRRIEYMSMFFVGVLVVRQKINLNFFIKILMIVIFFVFLFGLGQKYFAVPIVTTQNEEYAKGRALFYTVHGHLVSTFAGHYDLATFLILVSPIFLVILLSKKATEELGLGNKYVSQFLLAFTWIEGLWLLIYSASRISIVSYMIATVVALWLAKKYKAIVVVTIVVFVFTLFSGNLLTRYQRILDIVVEKITYQVEKAITVNAASGLVLAAEDVSSSIRFNVEWPRAIRAFTKNPLLGTGYSSITLATDNDYLRMLGEMGLFGFVAFSLIFVRLLIFIINKFKTLRENNLYSIYSACIFAAILGVLLNAVFIDVFEASKFAIIFWLLTGMAVGLHNEKN